MSFKFLLKKQEDKTLRSVPYKVKACPDELNYRQRLYFELAESYLIVGPLCLYHGILHPVKCNPSNKYSAFIKELRRKSKENNTNIQCIKRQVDGYEFIAGELKNWRFDKRIKEFSKMTPIEIMREMCMSEEGIYKRMRKLNKKHVLSLYAKKHSNLINFYPCNEGEKNYIHWCNTISKLKRLAINNKITKSDHEALLCTLLHTPRYKAHTPHVIESEESIIYRNHESIKYIAGRTGTGKGIEKKAYFRIVKRNYNHCTDTYDVAKIRREFKKHSKQNNKKQVKEFLESRIF
jgi:hypothetical protein